MHHYKIYLEHSLRARKAHCFGLKDFESVESELDKIFAIKERNFYFFERSRIDYKARLFQTADSLLKELRGSTKFLVKEFNPDTNKLTLEYLN